MKRLLIGIAMSLACSSSYAVTLLCDADGNKNSNSWGPGTENTHSLFVESVGDEGGAVFCDMLDVQQGRIENEKRVVKMVLKGAGLGLRYTNQEAFMINCPLVFTKERLTKNSFYGIKGSAGAALGASVGVFSNKRLGVCLLTSLSGGTIGVGLSGSKLTFK